MAVETRNLTTSEIDQYDYELPRHLIAQQPVASRVDARLLVVDRRQQSLTHHHIRDLPELLTPGDCLVLNDTQVVPARLLGRRESTGGHWEGLFLEVGQGGMWRILCKARGKLVRQRMDPPDQRARAGRHPRCNWPSNSPTAVGSPLPESDEETFALLERVGRVPLPPYIRKGEMEDADRQQYQTVYARWPGAVAAPTAGLHFSEPLLRRLEEDKIAICPLTLHTGAGHVSAHFRAAAGRAPHALRMGHDRPGERSIASCNAGQRRTGRGGGHDLRAALGNGRRRWYAQGVYRPHRLVHPPAVSSSTSSMPC